MASDTLADADGLGTISYQWKSDGADIVGATTSSLILAQAQVGHAITVVASYTDGFGQAESVASLATSSVANLNDSPAGSVSITGTATQGQTLMSSNTLTDADGLGTISYQWKSDGADIVGATSSSLTLAQAQVGHAITVVASYTDGFSHAESGLALRERPGVQAHTPRTKHRALAQLGSGWMPAGNRRTQCPQRVGSGRKR